MKDKLIMANTNNSSTEELDNINEIAEGIFKKSPAPANSIQLQFEEQTADFAQQDGYENFLFNILFLITLRGIEILYGHREILQLTKRQYQRVNEYVNSFGYIFKVTANNTSENLWDLVERGGLIRNYQMFFDKYK